jgi:C4-dicarboxylate-specific signal transduction histidine kinase/ActR/RegA family two-component response regulator
MKTADSGADVVRPVSRLRGLGLGARLVLTCTALAVLCVGLACAALGFEIRRQTRTLLANTLDRHQVTLLEGQARQQSDLLAVSRLMTESPTLRAAMETYRSERILEAAPRHDLLATVQEELDRIAGGLGRDAVIITDDDGRVLAASLKGGGAPAAGASLSGAPIIHRALADDVQGGAGGVDLLDLGGHPYRAGCVPIVLQGYTIGALVVGDAVDAAFAARLGAALDSDVLLAANGRVLATTLTGVQDDQMLAALTGLDGAARQTRLATLGGQEYVVASLPLGADGAHGGGSSLYLLGSLTRALEPSNRLLLRAFLIYGTLSAAFAGLVAWLLSRSILSPLERFVGFLREVTASGDRARRFEKAADSPEIRTLQTTYGQLMDSLDDYERRRLQQARDDMERMDRLKESEKLAALGRMLSGAAHEINNPLTGVLGNIDLLLGDTRIEPGARVRLEKVRREGHRIVALVRNLLKTAHRDGGQRAIVDLNQLLAECAGLRQHDFTAAGMRLHLDLGHGKCRVLASELELQQLFVNIINNAYDALKGSGAAPELIIRTTPGDETVAIHFLDNGPGIREPHRVFEHFYTTKEVGKGTGLGLSISHAIVQSHAGRIVATNRPEGGACFAISLPALGSSATGEMASAAAAEPVRVSASAPVTGSAPGTGEPGSAAPRAAASPGLPQLVASILVVDDEPSVLELELTILESVGASGIGARSGAEAVSQLERRSFDLVVSDLKMPGQVSGEDLFRWVQENRPDVAQRFVFVTGDTVSESTQQFLEKTGRRFIQKPFAIQDYLATLKGALDERKAA